MGSVLENIDKLIQMPYGCGEQNMLNFVPNIVVTRYLKATNRLTPVLKTKTEKYMEAGTHRIRCKCMKHKLHWFVPGYQRELTYQRDDFSYSAFGKSDKAGSTWLTAFVARSFHQAKDYIFVDDEKLKQSVKFLQSQQKENGAFTENGEVHHKAMQVSTAIVLYCNNYTVQCSIINVPTTVTYSTITVLKCTVTFINCTVRNVYIKT